MSRRQTILYILISVILLLVTAILDFRTGYEFSFFVFYYLPIFVLTWKTTTTYAVILSIIEAIIWFNIDRISGHHYPHWGFAYWNMFVRWTAFVIFIAAISKIKKERMLRRELSKAIDKIKHIVQLAKKIAEGDLNVSLPPLDNTKDDFTNATIDFMVKRLAEQKNLEHILNQLQQRAIVAEIAAYLAHEIRNPLNLILLTAHHLGTKFVPNEEATRKKYEELISSLKMEVEHLNRMITGFLAIGRPTEIKKSHFMLYEMIEQIQILLKPQLIKKNISLNIVGDKDLKIIADKEQIRLAVLNLLLNSLEAIETEGTVWIEYKFIAMKTKLTLTIADNGPGIKKEHLSQLFEPYFTTKANGNGLGLPLVKRIVEEHSGTITVENRPEKGACFNIILPFAEQTNG